jgi:hypothetical protein
MALAKGLTSRIVPALQAADFAVWEARKAYLKMQSWQYLPERPMEDRDAQWRHYVDWNRETTGEECPVRRKSLEALIEKAPIKAILWDYHQLDTMHDARRGIWNQEG